jgi:hypothetical protein
MRQASLNRTPSYYGVQEKIADLTTDGGRDKSAHIARRLVGCFYSVFLRLQHLAPICRNVLRKPKSLYLICLLHIAELCDGR